MGVPPRHPHRRRTMKAAGRRLRFSLQTQPAGPCTPMRAESAAALAKNFSPPLDKWGAHVYYCIVHLVQ